MYLISLTCSVGFLSKLITTGGKRSLIKEDLGACSKNQDSKKLYAIYEKQWEREEQLPEDKRSFFRAVFRCTGTWRWVVSNLLNIVTICLSFVPTMVLNRLVSDMEQENSGTHFPFLITIDMTMRWVYTLILLLVPIINACLNSVVMMMMVKLGVQMRTIAQEAVYRKALRLTSTAKGSTSTGQLVNIMSTDTNVLLQFVMIITILVMIPVMMVVCVILVVMQMGKLTWIAIGFYIVMLLCQFVTVAFGRKVRDSILKATDARVKLMNEVLTGIRVIKYYCWEKPFKGKIHDIRHVELKQHAKMGYIMGTGIQALSSLIPNIVPLVSFALYPSVMGEPLKASTAYTSLSLFKILQMPFMMMPMCMMMLVQFNVSIKRITDFLDLPEVDPSLVERDVPAGTVIKYKDAEGVEKEITDYDASKDAVIIRDGCFAWGNNENCLNNINVRIPKGSLVAVVGRVGSGKTSFVSSLVGEMTKNGGVVVVNGTMSLSAQQAWLVNDTVRNNILFGKPYEEKKYNDIIKVCCLEDDLKMLSGGDECEIGDRGINVSGGQKARISLARCCYSDSDVVVMDDPIAAVDSHVGKALFNKCISKYMTGRTRILVTNATQYLHKCDYIVVLENNTIAYQGTYDQLKASNIDLMALLTEEDGSSSFSASRRSMHEQEEKSRRESQQEAISHPNEEVEKEEGQLTTEETKRSGSISLDVYKYYFKAVGMCLLAVVLLSFVVATTATIISQVILSNWSGDKSCAGEYNEVCKNATSHYILTYGICIICYAIFTILRVYLSIPARVKAAQNIHDNLTNVILDAPVAFHDVTPVGRVLNRFNRDMVMVDDEMPRSADMFLNQLFMLIAECINIIWTTRGIMLPVIIIAFVIYGVIQQHFRRANTDIQRIESLSRSPIFTDFQGVLNGSPSIRAYNHQDRFIAGIEKKVNVNSNVNYIYQCGQAWLSLRSDIIAAFIMAAVAVISNFASSWMSASLLGLALSSCSGLGNQMKQTVRMMAQTEAMFNSVERIKEYVDTVKPEPPMITDVRPPQGWPSEGRIEYVNAKLRYRDGPLVMKGVNLSINPHEKVGVVGRTGAGKSTMMIALFRITDLCDGCIKIDDVDLGKLGLEDVRRALCIIPQDPVLFSASVRFNLDPFNESTDEDIWSVLEQVELKDVIDRLPKKLDDAVAEGGSNFSVGQRQLICMARALLRKSKILIMDEATASLDNETDIFLQKMIRKQFASCTTLTIAHRLNTIMDSNRVCVMDAGVVAEYDTPYNLLHKENGIFRGMVVAANDPTLFDMVPGCEDLKSLLEEKE